MPQINAFRSFIIFQPLTNLVGSICYQRQVDSRLSTALGVERDPLDNAILQGLRGNFENIHVYQNVELTPAQVVQQMQFYAAPNGYRQLLFHFFVLPGGPVFQHTLRLALNPVLPGGFPVTPMTIPIRVEDDDVIKYQNTIQTL